MIKCANCHHDNMEGAAFCTECGALLMPAEMLTTQKIETEPSAGGAQPRPPAPPPLAPSADNWITLHLLETGVMLPLTERNEFTIGRIAEGQSIMPDVDLSPYQAYAHGVSRLHAVIQRGVDNILLTDLESANGTFVNGQRLPARQPLALAHGDLISLGGLRIQVLFRT